MKKYELITGSIRCGDKKMYQIKALKDFAKVKKGQLGGHIQSEENLCQKGNCWINVGGIVLGGYRVCDDTTISDDYIRGDDYLYLNRYNNSNPRNRDDCGCNWDDIFTMVAVFATLATIVIFAIVGVVCLVS